ncbi:hypothetical protein [Dongia sp.]|uniref:hypothetical protein n=1 Tax=Dongia sp. TaxID=1977262 RepID=UPI0035B24190
MAEIGPLLLPPPTAISGGGRTPVRVGSGRGETDEERLALSRVDETADATSGPAGGSRAKQFRFRVVDGGRSDALGNAEVPARTQTETVEAETAAARAGSAAIGGDSAAPKTGNGSVPLGTPLAAFLAQLIAQEQLQAGLHDPPVKAADRAYRQAGAEPSLNEGETAIARFRIAV